MADVNQLNPFKSFNVGLGDVGNMILLVFIVAIIVGGIGFLIWWRVEQKRYIYQIPLYRYYEGVAYKVQNKPFLAKSVQISKAGDSLWYVKGIKRWIEPAIFTDGLNSFPHYLTKDGEWVNFAIGDVDSARKEAGVHYTHQDMRSNRVSVGELLEQRLLNKSFWEKYKDILINIIFFFITAIAMVVIFWQWSGIVEQTANILARIDTIIQGLNNLECIGTKPDGLIPV